MVCGRCRWKLPTAFRQQGGKVSPSYWPAGRRVSRATTKRKQRHICVFRTARGRHRIWRLSKSLGRDIPGFTPRRRHTARSEIGRAHVCTPVTNAHLVCRLLLEKKKIENIQRQQNIIG